MEPETERMLRTAVQAGVQNAVCRHPHSAPGLPAKRIQAAVTTAHRLCFQKRLPDTLFTESRIEAEGKLPVQISIINTASKEIIRSGPLSRTKVEILVLNGDFDGDGQEEWTEEEFCGSIVQERERKGNLLIGELIITLNDGVGYLGDLTFTDNSSWMRSRKFRLGARSRWSEGRIHEAITEAFLVKDHRGKSYEKHHPPALSDKVWRLEKIGKDGAFHTKLAESGIDTVQDFLRNFFMDQDRLRSLLGNGMKNKMWEAIVKHANEFVLDDKCYAYSSGQGVVLLFDSIFRLVGATFDHTEYPLEGLTAHQKVLVNELKVLAYKNPSNIKPHMIEAVSLPRNPDLSATHIDEAATQLGFQHQPQVPSYQLLGDQSQLTDEAATQLGFQHQPQVPSNQLLGDQSQLTDEAATQLGFQHQPQVPSYQLLGDQSKLTDEAATQLGFQHQPQVPSYQLLGDQSQLTDEAATQLGFYTTGFDLQNEDFLTGGSLGSIMTDEYLTAFISEANIASSSQPPMPWGRGNGTIQASRSYVTQLTGTGARISSGYWVVLMAASKWVKISKRVSAKRARIEDLGYPIVASSLCASARGGYWP